MVKEERRKYRQRKETAWLIISLLVMIAIICYFLLYYIGRISHNSIVMMGNVDVIEVNFDKQENNNNDKNDDIHETVTKNILTITDNVDNDGENVVDENPEIVSPNPPEVTPTPPVIEKNGFIAYDDNVKYEKNTVLNIFKHNSNYTIREKIAPGSKNTYQFVVRNNNEFDINYDIEMTEVNAYDLNLMYKLKLNGKYVVGDENTYVSVENLNQYNNRLGSYEYNVYELEWKWIEGENDTEIGEKNSVSYNLNMRICAEEILNTNEEENKVG